MTRIDDSRRRFVPISPEEAYAQDGRVAELTAALEQAAQVFEMLHSGVGLAERDELAICELCQNGLRRIAETKGEAANNEAMSIWRATDTGLLADRERYKPGEDPS